MASIIESQIKHSLAHSNYDRVIEGLGTMREELVDYEEPAVYNDFLRALKAKLLAEELGGDRTELWWFVRKGKLGLIEKREVASSTVEDDEARQVGLFSSLWAIGQGADAGIVFGCEVRETDDSIAWRFMRSLMHKSNRINV